MLKPLLNVDDRSLLKDVRYVLKEHIEDIESLLTYRNIVEEGFFVLPSNQHFKGMYYLNKENLLLAYYILRSGFITTFVEEHCGMSLDNRRFLNDVKADLNQYQKEIGKIERRLNQ